MEESMRRKDWVNALRLPLAAFALALACICALAPARAYAATADTSWYTSNKAATTYTISDVPDLMGLAELVNAGTEDFEGKTVKVDSSSSAVTSLRLSGEWTPIGTEDNPFNGTFDGQGVSISGLSIASGSDGLGLFGYAGEDSLITDVSVTGSISIEKSSSSTDIVLYVGGVVGYTQGSLSECTSAVDIEVYSAVEATEDNTALIKYVGGVAGRVSGDIDDCDTRSTGSVLADCSSASYSSSITWVIGYVGGVVGMHGPEADDTDGIGSPSTISDCDNAASVTVQTYAAGPSDRFGNPTNATGQFLGGIAGWSSGNIIDCTNTADVDSGYYDSDGNAQNSYGTTGTGGIVGALRVDETVVAAGDEDDPGLRYNKATAGGEALITVSGCVNTGDVFGLAQTGGIVGQAGSYTLVTASYNTGDVEASRYTKPSPGGVVGRSYGMITYCYNTGDVISTTGGGYYAAGIVGMFHSIGTDYNGDAIVPEAYSCFNAGYILTDTEAYRSGSIVGELDGGYIHDCVSLSNRANTGSVSGLDNYTGTITNTVEVDEKAASAASTVALLNACCDKDGWEIYYTLPEGKAWGTSGVYPVLATSSYDSATDLSGVSGATVTTTASAQYSASMDPVPSVSVVLSDGTTLVQNADYRVIGQEGTAGVDVSDTAYEATIVGVGNYMGTLGQTATYTIAEGDIGTCTVTAVAKYFNYEKQEPDTVTLFDSAGNEVPSDQYTWTVDETMFADTTGSDAGSYLNAQNENENEGYPITVAAVDGGNYTGSQTAYCFKIKQVSFAYSASSDNPYQDTLIIGDVIWGDETWEFLDVCDYTTNNAIGSETKRGTMKVTYTGSPITPTITGITYLDHDLVEIQDGDAWYNDPTAYGYKLLYGNPNPELGSTNQVTSDLESVTDATGDDYAAFTIRSAPYSNFDNYVTIWFEITPASIADDVTVTGFADTVALSGGAATQDDVVLTYNDMTLEEGTDYEVSYSSNTQEGTATVTYTGMGNYDDTLTLTYEVTASGSSSDGSASGTISIVDDVTMSGFADTVAYSVRSAKQTGVVFTYGGTTLVEGVDYVASYESDPDNNTATVTYTGIGDYTDTMTLTYQTTGSAEAFSDVDDTAWYVTEGALPYAVFNEILNGYSGSDRFGPNDNITRGQMAVVLYNMAQGTLNNGESTSGLAAYAANSFSDVSSDKYYAEAIGWVLKADVAHGYSGSDRFGPEDNITREQLAIMITNFAAYYGLDTTSDPSTAFSGFNGADEVHSWAEDAMAWCVEQGIITGSKENGALYLRPLDNATRAQMCKMVMVVWRDLIVGSE